jgi:hypothetical protein
VIDLLDAALSVQRLCRRHRWRLKTFANRPKDWVDVEGVLGRQRGKLKWRYSWNQLRPLVELKQEPEILAGLKRLQRG